MFLAPVVPCHLFVRLKRPCKAPSLLSLLFCLDNRRAGVLISCLARLEEVRADGRRSCDRRDRDGDGCGQCRRLLLYLTEVKTYSNIAN